MTTVAVDEQPPTCSNYHLRIKYFFFVFLPFFPPFFVPFALFISVFLPFFGACTARRSGVGYRGLKGR
jgi:hypothetical protein